MVRTVLSMRITSANPEVYSILRYLNVWVLIHEPGIRHEMVRAIQWYRCSIKCCIIQSIAFSRLIRARMHYKAGPCVNLKWPTQLNSCDSGRLTHANYPDSGRHVAQKVRSSCNMRNYPDSGFSVVHDQMYGKICILVSGLFCA